MADNDRTKQLEETNRALEARLADLERRLMAEREKALSSAVQEQAAVSVDTALKDMQEKLRREKREQELDAARQAAEAKSRDLERRLAEERDMWVTVMKDHLARGGDNKPLLQEISALKSSLAQKDEEMAALREQSLKGGGDQKVLQKEVSSLKDLLGKQEAAIEAKVDEVRLLKEQLAVKDKNLEAQSDELMMRMSSMQQALAEKDTEEDELRRQAEAAQQETERARKALAEALKNASATAAAELERDRATFQKHLKEQQQYHAKLASRIEELEKDIGGRDAMMQSVRAENEALQARMTELVAAKDAESRLMRENLQRLGRQNKELLAHLQEAAGAAAAAPAPAAPVSGNFQEMLSSLEDALTQRDRVLEDQQKSIDEKKGLIDGLFSDLKSLDEQAVALLEEKARATQELNDKINALTTENERLRRMAEAASAAPAPAAPAPAAEAPPAEAPAAPADAPPEPPHG
jgi:chromosome segregation ATPase